jgi:membrane associated rhomboid family serine protease
MTSARVCSGCRRLMPASEIECSHCGARISPPKKARPPGEGRGPFAAPLAATKFLVGLCLLNFAMLVLMNGGIPFGLFGPQASSDALVGAGAIAGRLAFLQPWRLLSANFVHLHLLHLGFNMYALLSFGRAFEERFDGPKLVVVFALTGVCGFLLSSLLYGVGPTTAGASASLFGLIGVEVAYLIGRRDPLAKEVFFQYPFMAVALALVFPVNNYAHLGGFLSGLPFGYLLHRVPRSRGLDRAARWASILLTAAAVLSILLCLLTLLALRNSP